MEDTFSGRGNGTKYVPVGRFFYSSNSKRPQLLGNGLQSWRGFYQSLKPTQMGLSLNIDMSATAFIEPLPVIEFVAQVLGKDVYSRPLSDADYVKVKKALRGVEVEVTHRGNMRRKYRISGLTSQPTRELIFPVDEDKNMKSVIDYFQEVYGFTIRHSHLPCLLVGSARKVNYLPMEASKIVEGQRYSKRLNDKQITSLLKLSCQRPKEQEAEILQSAIGLPDGGHILCLSETKIVHKTLNRKCRSMSVLSLEDHIQHVDRRWEDAAKSHGTKRICRQLVIHRLSTAKHIRKQPGIHRWPFQRVTNCGYYYGHDWATMKGYSLGDERPVEVISLSTHAKLVSRLQLLYISWLGRFLPRPSALPGREIVGPIALSSSEFAAIKNIAQGVKQSDSAAFDSGNERTREQEEPEEIYTSITSDDLQRLKGRMNRKDAAASLGVSVSTFKRKCRDYGIDRWPHVRNKKGIHITYSLAPISFEVLETLLTREKPNDSVPLLSLGRLTLEDCVQQEKSLDLPRVTQINGVEQRVTKMPRYLGGLTPQFASSSRWPIGLLDGGHIDLLDPLVQFTTNIEHAARADQCSPTESRAEKKMVRKTLKRMCRTMSVIFEENHQHFARRCKGAAESLGAMRIFRKHGINQVSPVKRIHKQHSIRQWPFRQKWATRKGYSLGDERPFEVSSLYMDEKLDSRLQFIHMSKFARSSPRALTLSDGGEIVGPVALSLSEFAATNNRAHLVKQDQSGSTAPHYECKNTRETSDKQGLEDLKRHFGCKDKDAVKSLGVSVSMFKSTCRQHWVYCWPGQFENNEQQAFDATNNRAHLVKADESGPTVSNSEKGSTREGLKRDCLTNALSLEDLRQHFGARHKDAAEGLCDSPAWKSFKVLDSLPLGERSNSIRYLARWRTLMHKHCVRLKKSQDLLRSLQRDCSGGLAPQSDSGLPDGGHILSLSEKKIVRKTLKRKCRTMSVLSLEDHQRHVGWRWEDAVKFLGTKRISRQLAIHCETTAKRIHRQLGTRRWPFKQIAIGLSDGGHILSLSEKKIVRKTLKRKCRSMSVLSLEDHKQHVDGRWEDAAKSHGAKRICRQLVIHHLSTAKRIRKQHGIHRWPFQRSAVGLPDGHILPLLVDRRQHVDRRWEDATMNIGAKHICRQLVIHCVSIATRIYRQHGIYHQWPFQQDWTTMKGYSLGDERPVEVISLSTHVKLVPRLQLIYISWLGRFSPRPSALAGGGEIGGPIALSLSESAATKNIAQHVEQDQSGSAASDSENERTREQGDPEEINATITLHDIRRHYGRRNREDAAASLAISVSTFKRKCREYGIKRWPHVRKRKVGRPPDQHGEGNTSIARETPLHYVQTGMEGELVRQNEVSNVFQRDFMGGPIALNTESGLIMVSRPPDQHGERNTSTACGTPSRNVETGMEVEPVGQNQEANVFQRDFMYGPIALNTDGLTFPECSDAVGPSQPMATILDTIPHLNGGSSECAFQVKNQSTQFTANPYPLWIHTLR